MAILNPKTFHRVLFAFYCYCFYYDYQHTSPTPGSNDDYARNSLGGRYKYITIVNFVIQIGYFGVCVVNDLVGVDGKLSTNTSILQKLRDWLFTTITVPVASLVCFVYWVLFLYDRELIHPAEIDLWFPQWLNQSYHTLPIIAVAVELTIVQHHYRRGMNRYYEVTAFFFCYSVWMFYTAYKINFWIYPIFEILNVPMRALFMGIMLTIALLFAYLGSLYHRVIWGNAEEKVDNRKKSKNK